MRVYADSSFLVSCYLVDANTPRAKVFLSAKALRMKELATFDSRQLALAAAAGLTAAV